MLLMNFVFTWSTNLNQIAMLKTAHLAVVALFKVVLYTEIAQNVSAVGAKIVIIH